MQSLSLFTFNLAFHVNFLKIFHGGGAGRESEVTSRGRMPPWPPLNESLLCMCMCAYICVCVCMYVCAHFILSVDSLHEDEEDGDDNVGRDVDAGENTL